MHFASFFFFFLLPAEGRTPCSPFCTETSQHRWRFFASIGRFLNLLFTGDSQHSVATLHHNNMSNNDRALLIDVCIKLTCTRAMDLKNTQKLNRDCMKFFTKSLLTGKFKSEMIVIEKNAWLYNGSMWSFIAKKKTNYHCNRSERNFVVQLTIVVCGTHSGPITSTTVYVDE